MSWDVSHLIFLKAIRLNIIKTNYQTFSLNFILYYGSFLLYIILYNATVFIVLIQYFFSILQKGILSRVYFEFPQELRGTEGEHELQKCKLNTLRVFYFEKKAKWTQINPKRMLKVKAMTSQYLGMSANPKNFYFPKDILFRLHPGLDVCHLRRGFRPFAQKASPWRATAWVCQLSLPEIWKERQL